MVLWRSIYLLLFYFFCLIEVFSFPDVFFQQHGQQRTDDQHEQNTAFGASLCRLHVGGEKSDNSRAGSSTYICHVLGNVVLQGVPRVSAEVKEICRRTSRTGK